MNPYLYAVLFLILYLFFSGVQSMYRHANRILIEFEKHKSGVFSFVLKKITHDPPRFSAAMFIGEIIALILFTGCVFPIIYAAPTPITFVLYGSLILIVLILLRVIISKILCKIYANDFIRFFAFPALLFYPLFYPFADLAIRTSYLISKIFYKQPLQPFYTGFTSDISEYISDQIESAGNREEVDAEIRIFQNALVFPDVIAKEVMTPRTEIIAVEIGSLVENLQKLFQETGYSKILVYKNSLDTIVGYVHSFELFKKSGTVKDMLISPIFVPESMPAGTVLKKLIKARKSIAVVIDEFGGTAGMLTTEDIVEELFGEIEDEHDSEELLEIQLSENRFRFSARLEVDYINQKYHLNLPEDDSYETLGGMIFYYAKEIPKKGEIIAIIGYQAKILSVSNTRIQEIELSF
ncbi:MAG TPA: hemolysin family protein [Flavobacteriaceae bacterium]|nr:hemolysin family protein [Flavobacteriaceae bacterium]